MKEKPSRPSIPLPKRTHRSDQPQKTTTPLCARLSRLQVSENWSLCSFIDSFLRFLWCFCFDWAGREVLCSGGCLNRQDRLFCKSLGTVFLWRLGMRESRSGTDEDWWPICDFSSDWCDSLMWSRVCSSHGKVWLPVYPCDRKVWHCPGCQMRRNQDCILTEKLLSYWNPRVLFKDSNGICILAWPFPVRYRFPGYRMKCLFIYVETGAETPEGANFYRCSSPLYVNGLVLA